MTPDLSQTGWIAGALTLASTLFRVLANLVRKGPADALERRVKALETDATFRNKLVRVLLREAHSHGWDLAYKADDYEI